MPSEHAARRRWRRGPLIALVCVVVVIAAVVLWSSHEAANYYAYTPGSAPVITTSRSCRLGAGGGLTLPDGTPCARLTVPSGRGHEINGRLLMVDVLVGKATPADWLLDELGLLGTVHPGAQLYKASAVLGQAPASQLTCEDDQEMVDATTSAPLVALQRLGYDVRQDNLGAQIDLVLPGSAAARAGIRCNDLVTAVGGRPVTTAEQLAAAIRARKPGQSVPITVQRDGAHGKADAVHLVAKLTGVPAMQGSPAEPHTAFLGISSETRTLTKLPFDVGIDVGDIGGPSAGLALTLGILDVLSGGRLTGGHVVAATGTISPGGAVGDVGGVAQKTVAVRKAGATLFLVPIQELKVARSEAGPHLKVEAVTTLSQALADLKAIGGTIPAAG